MATISATLASTEGLETIADILGVTGLNQLLTLYWKREAADLRSWGKNKEEEYYEMTITYSQNSPRASQYSKSREFEYITYNRRLLVESRSKSGTTSHRENDKVKMMIFLLVNETVKK
jgi:hypothetical protein